MRNSIRLCVFGYEAEILKERGANLISFSCPRLGIKALRTPLSMDDFSQFNPYLYGIPVLFPPNRISGARFTFENRDYVFPMNEPKIGNFLHGTLHQTTFECVKQTKNSAEFEYRATKEAPYLTFPHAFTMCIRYTLLEDGMHQRITITNDSDENMPVALGFHTTFSLPFVQDGDIKNIRLMLDVDKEYLRNMETFLPTGEVLAEFDIKQALLHNGIVPFENNISRHFSMGENRTMTLVDTKKKVGITYSADENYHYWMIYNGGNSDFICVEPQTWLNNCPNAPFTREQTGFTFLKPGEEKIYATKLSLAFIG